MQGLPLQQTADGLPDLLTFGRELSPRAPQHRSIKQLHAALLRCDPSAPLLARVSGLESLFAWLASRQRVPALPDAQREAVTLSRLRWLLLAVEKLPGIRARL